VKIEYDTDTSPGDLTGNWLGIHDRDALLMMLGEKFRRLVELNLLSAPAELIEKEQQLIAANLRELQRINEESQWD
jgi:hypothetical protein